MAFMGDFARMPTQRKVGAFVIAGVLLGLLYWQFFYKSLASQVEAIDNDHQAKVDENKQKEADIPKYEELKTRMTKLRHTLEVQERALPTEAELPAFFETLNRKVLESGVEVKMSQRQLEEKVETFVKVPVTFEISGTFMQIKKFFASLLDKRKKPGASESANDTAEDHDRIVSIENLKINDPQVINHDLVMRATFTATTYREEVKPDAVKAPTFAPSGGGKLPPADTPAGAKARVENSMDKDANRTNKSPQNPDKLKEGK